MVGLTREQRAERDAARAKDLNEAKQSSDPFAVVGASQQQLLDATNDIDERRPDWRPSTLVNVDTQEAAPDERRFAGDEGKALNQMVGRAAITENHDPQPYITARENAPAVRDPYERPMGEGDEIRLLRGYQEVEGQPKRQAGEILRVPGKEAKRLVNAGAAKFTEGG